MRASQAAGETTPALLTDTIYDNLLGTARAHPDAEGLVSRHQRKSGTPTSARTSTDRLPDR